MSTPSPDSAPILVASGTLAFPSRSSIDTPPSVDLSSLTQDLTPPVVNTETQGGPSPVTTERPLPFFAPLDATAFPGRKIADPLSAADRSAEFFSLSLPSGFVFYPFKRLSSSLVRGVQQSKFSRSAKEVNLRYTVEAVTSCLGDGVDAMDLTIMDFFYVMYWLRLASFTKFDFTHIAVCSNADHVSKVKDGKLDVKSLKSVHIIKQTQMEEKQLDANALNALDFSCLQQDGFKLGYSTMRDTVVFSEEFEPRDPEYKQHQYLCDLASLLHPSHGSLRERMDLVAKMSGDQTRELEAYQDVLNSYGVLESVVVKCKECGAAIRTNLSVAAHSFF